MANPAELLHGQLNLWFSRKNQTEIRGLGDGSSLEAWDQQRNAARNLENLLQLINELEEKGERVDVERLYIPHWIKAVYAFPHGWQQSTGGYACITAESLNILKSFGYRVDNIVLPVRPGALDDMLSAAEEAEQAIDSDIPKALKLLIFESVSFLRKAVKDYEITGEFILNTAVKKFISSLDLLAREQPESSVARNIAARVSNWYQKPVAQLVLAGFISAEMALTAPGLNEAAASAIETVSTIFESRQLPPGGKTVNGSE